MMLRLPSLALFLGAFAAVSTAAAQTTPTPNPFGMSAPAAPAQATPAPKKARAPAAPKAGQFAGEAEAKASCPGEPVVWVNTSSKIYHRPGAATYGKTKRGFYMCEKDTAAAGYRAAKNEKR
jgi:hypothetical protein